MFSYYFIECLYSSVAEHWSCKPGVVSSTLTGGKLFFPLFFHYLMHFELSNYAAAGTQLCKLYVSQVFFPFFLFDLYVLCIFSSLIFVVLYSIQ